MKNDSQHLLPENLIRLTQFCKAAMMVLNARLLILLGLFMCCAMFAWVMWQPDPVRAGAACAFALLVFWPLQRLELERREKIQRQQQEEKQ